MRSLKHVYEFMGLLRERWFGFFWVGMEGGAIKKKCVFKLFFGTVSLFLNIFFLGRDLTKSLKGKI